MPCDCFDLLAIKSFPIWQKPGQEFHRQGEDNGGIFLSWDSGECLQVAQLNCLGSFRDDVCCLLQRSWSIHFTLRCNYLQGVTARWVLDLKTRLYSKSSRNPTLFDRNLVLLHVQQHLFYHSGYAISKYTSITEETLLKMCVCVCVCTGHRGKQIIAEVSSTSPSSFFAVIPFPQRLVITYQLELKPSV